jgi:hypothetical protein
MRYAVFGEMRKSNIVIKFHDINRLEINVRFLGFLYYFFAFL